MSKDRRGILRIFPIYPTRGVCGCSHPHRSAERRGTGELRPETNVMGSCILHTAYLAHQLDLTALSWSSVGSPFLSFLTDARVPDQITTSNRIKDTFSSFFLIHFIISYRKPSSDPIDIYPHDYPSSEKKKAPLPQPHTAAPFHTPNSYQPPNALFLEIN